MLLYRGDSDWATKLVAGIKAGKEESWARCECHDYTQGLLNLVLDKESGLSDVLTSVSIEEVLIVTSRRAGTYFYKTDDDSERPRAREW